jgi:uncharacterized protein YprB with RNaseH-like and TPR domain
MALVFDIETIGTDFDKLDDVSKHQLTRWIKRESGGNEGKHNALLQDVKEGLGFSPLTGEIVAIGVYDTDKHKGVVYYQAPDVNAVEEKQENFIFKPRTEEEMIKDFWRGATKYNTFISFNGRSFDVPFILLRGAKYKIKPLIDLMQNRYLRNQYNKAKHIDLLDQFSFYGAVRRRGNLHLYCEAFGIRSPKSLGITGDDVGRLFKDKKYIEIAEYNSWDLTATAELYEIWQKYLNV